MDNPSEKTTETNSSVPAEPKPRSLALAEAGVRTGNDFARLMSAVMSDLISGTMSPSVGNAVCSAGRGLLKVVEMQHRYGTQHQGKAKVLELAGD